MATYLKKKPVLVAVYVEKPRKRGSSKTNKNNQHKNDHHLQIDRSKNGGGYNRRAELLSYSNRLRDFAKSSSSPHQPKPLVVVSTTKDQQQPPPAQIIHNQKEQKVKIHQACFQWKSLTPKMFKFNKDKKKKNKKNITNTFLSRVMTTIQKFR